MHNVPEESEDPTAHTTDAPPYSSPADLPDDVCERILELLVGIPSDIDPAVLSDMLSGENPYTHGWTCVSCCRTGLSGLDVDLRFQPPSTEGLCNSCAILSGVNNN